MERITLNTAIEMLHGQGFEIAMGESGSLNNFIDYYNNTYKGKLEPIWDGIDWAYPMDASEQIRHFFYEDMRSIFDPELIEAPDGQPEDERTVADAISTAKVIAFAKKRTEEAANVKDYKLNKAGKIAKAKAQELAKGDGYIVATAEEVGQKGDCSLHIWCYYASKTLGGKTNIELALLR